MFAIATLTLLCLAAPQDPTQILATFTLNGKPATITRTDIALEMAFHLRRDERGRQGCEMLVDALITRNEATRQNVMPTRQDAQAFWEQLKDQLIKAGRNPQEFAAVRNTDEEQWLQDLSVQIAQERLVRKELGLSKNDKVSGEMLKLWLGEARQRAKVETDPDKLPVGTAALVNQTPVPLIDLGFLLLRTSEDFERDESIRRLASLQAIETLAASKSLKITPADLDQAIETRRAQAKQDPRLGGVPFEQFLKARGMTIESLREMRVFRAHVMLDKLTLLEYPDEVLKAEIQTKNAEVLAEVGPRRRIGAIFVRAMETPNAIITRSFDEAMSHLRTVRERIAKDGFAATASIESELGDSKRKGGDVGWHRPNSTELPEAVVHAAFAMDMTEVSMPIRADDGCYVITVLDREPVPNEAELIRRLRIVRGDELQERIAKGTAVEIVGQKKAADGAESSQGNDRSQLPSGNKK